MGDRDHAFEWLEKGYAERSGRMEYIKNEDFFEPFHSDPRYIDLLKRMGLPQSPLFRPSSFSASISTHWRRYRRDCAGQSIPALFEPSPDPRPEAEDHRAAAVPAFA